ISGDPVKFRCARRRGGWGRISVEGPGQHNPDRSEGPWGRAGDCSKGSATTQGPAESWASWRRRTKGRCKPSGTEGMPGGGLTEARGGKARSERPAWKPYWGKPAVRNFRGGDGNVAMGAELRPISKDIEISHRTLKCARHRPTRPSRRTPSVACSCVLT